MSLEFDPGNKETFEKWVKVFDRVRKGEMPPKKKRQPDASEKSQFLGGLGKPLLEFDMERQMIQGRGMLRRLNRTEYEYTLRDLFGIPYLRVKDLLPADSQGHGFDTVAESLELSYVQITRYLEAAHYALDEAINRELEDSQKTSVKSKVVKTLAKDSARFKIKNGEVGTVGDTRVVLRQDNGKGLWRIGFTAPATGSYRVKMNSYGVGWNDGKIVEADRPHAVSLEAETGKIRRKLHMFDIPNDVEGIQEATVQMQEGDIVSAFVETIGATNEPKRNNKRGIPYAGPGVAFEWFEVEGPLGSEEIGERPKLFEGLGFERWSEASGLEVPSSSDGNSKNTLMVVSKNSEIDAKRLLKKFMERAYRRPVTDEDAGAYVPLVMDQIGLKKTFGDAMRTGFKAVLCSPDFLFFKEVPGRLDEYALASRLSYFLWKSMPDAELMELAAKGELSKPEVLHEQTERLLKNENRERFVEDFLGQWLELRRISFTQPDKQLYPEFTGFLQDSMVEETHTYFDAMLDEDLSADYLVESDFTFLNEPLAKLYSVPGVEGLKMRRVKLPEDSPRGGILTQGSVMKITANGTTTSPVTRGVWIQDRLMGEPVPPPPPGAGSIDPDTRGTTTIREQLEKHRSSESCNTCHQNIDPPGFALESFDVIGGWRDQYRALSDNNAKKKQNGEKQLPYFDGPPVDPSGLTSKGEKFENIGEFRKLLLKDRDQLARNLAERFVVYSTGAPVGFADRRLVDDILSKTRDGGHGARSLIHAVVQSPIFQFK